MALTTDPVLVALTPGGLALAKRLAPLWSVAEVHGRAGRAEPADVTFADTVSHLQSLFQAGRPLLVCAAAGIVIRTLAPLLAHKHEEPPVLAVAEDGSAVVPLLGGHRGANVLARQVADALGVKPAITTAGDLAFGVALDAPPAGWHLANREDYKDFAAQLLSGCKVVLTGKAPWLQDSNLPFADTGALGIDVTEKVTQGSSNRLIYHPEVLALGVGCERGAPAEELITLVRETLAAAGLAPAALAGVYSIDVKADEPAVHALAEALGRPVRFFDAARLNEEHPRLATPSALVFQEVGCHGVAEGAALAAAGPEAELIVAKTKSKRATCAVARAPSPIGEVGRARGVLKVVGLGPGDDCWRTPEAEAALKDASDLVGYRLYLDLAGRLAEGKTRHDYDLGEEESRVRHALELAAQGKHVALVCSGDPGIYAMATLVFELLDREDRPDWKQVQVTVAPGISALQAAAARVGAPLGHDFCAISLSDLLTPWEAIERRLEAAAAGDFVVALYNPVSRRRIRQLARALEIFGQARPASTPVVLARNLGRPGETVTLRTLGEVKVAEVDMLTVVLVGASSTRRIERGDGGAWVYTPRGYEAKAARAEEHDKDPEAAA